MTHPITLFRSQLDEYDDCAFLQRIVAGIGKTEQSSETFGCFAPINAPRIALLNRCKDLAKKPPHAASARDLFFIQPFNAWNYLSIGNLSVALLWHIYKSLPGNIVADEKVIYRLGKISITLPALSNILSPVITSPHSNPETGSAINSTMLTPEKRSSVSATFSVCEQIHELSETFTTLSSHICSLGNFDSLVVPVLDTDLCLPHQSISLLYTIKNMFCSKHLTFIIVTDHKLLSAAITSTYGQAVFGKLADNILFSFFDDWISVPAPSLKHTLQMTDAVFSPEERNSILKLITTSGILPLLPDSSCLQDSFNRFIRCAASGIPKFEKTEYGTVALLFLLSTTSIDQLRKCAQLPDLSEFIDKARKQSQVRSVFPAHVTQHKTKKETTSDLPLSYFELLYNEDKILSLFFSHVPTSVSNSRLAELMRTVAPFF